MATQWSTDTMWDKPVMIEVKSIRFGGFDFSGEVMENVEIWTVTHVHHWVGNDPVVETPNGIKRLRNDQWRR